MQRRMQALPGRLRLFTAEARDLPRAFLLTGQRGVGKSTFLLHHAKGRRFLYCSADSPLLAATSLYDLGHAALMRGYEGLIVDEAHFARDWSIHLKALYDDFPDRAIWVSDSSSLVLRSGLGDLSRRFVPIRIPLLSFREFIALKTNDILPVFSPFGAVPVTGTSEVLALFREYRSTGTRPFFSEGNFRERMLAILEKSLYTDVPFLLPGVNEGNLRLMSAIAGTLAKSAIPRLQVRSLCADWGIGAEKLYQILFAMESVGILRIMRKENDTKARTAGEKLFFGDPAFYYALEGDRGSAREALVAAMLTEGGCSVFTTADENQGDFAVRCPQEQGNSSILVEIGGSAKERKKADFVIRDDIDYPAGRAIPMWALGFIY